MKKTNKKSKTSKTNFRKFITSSKKKVFAGKNAEQNEEIIKQAKNTEIVLHTKEAGSPFVNIKGKATAKDIREAAVFCAKHSRKWKKAKRKPSTIDIHYFKGKDVFKTTDMKTGTFGVTNHKNIKIKKKEIESLDKLDKSNNSNKNVH